MRFPLCLLLAILPTTLRAADKSCADAADILPSALAAFDVYSANDLVYACSDFEGAAGAARDVVLTRFYVGGGIAAGRNLVFADGDVAGGVEAGLGVFIRNYTAGSVTAGGDATCLEGTSDLCASDVAALTDHAAVVAAMSDAAGRIAALAPSGSAPTVASGHLSAAVASGLNVLDIGATALVTHGGLTLDGPSDAIVIVRVTGITAPLTLDGGQVALALSGGLSSTGVLFAFLDAPALTFTHLVVPGTILAPAANVTLLEGRVDGGLYAADLNGFAFPSGDLRIASPDCSTGPSGAQVNHAPFRCAQAPYLLPGPQR
jgi:choice-of-anchor A domain-containing protein